MKYLKDKIMSLDTFGYPVDLNFDKKGNYHQTLVGGCFTIALFSGMAFHVIQGIQTIIYHGQDKNSQF